MKRIFPAALLHAALSAFSLAAAASGPADFFQSYVVLGENGRAIARVVTAESRCPTATVDGKSLPMERRVAAGRVPDRGSAQKDSKDTDFPVTVCEAVLPPEAKHVTVAGTRLPTPVAAPRRVVFIGDTGCRMKASEDAFQACNDGTEWPFEAVSKAAAAWKPDLVVHLGDVLYRESPCPEGDQRCAGSPWGYGFDAWSADFFSPARALLAAAPWVAVRGNHESCARAGRGWFRFLDAAPYRPARSCDDPANDQDADFSTPYAVPIAGNSQLIVFDSSRAGGKPLKQDDPAFAAYAKELRQVDELVRAKPRSLFLMHHPILGFAGGKNDAVHPGNGALQSVMRSLHAESLFAPGIDLALHGHVHLFEAISFASNHPATFVAGNSGSDLGEPLPATLPLQMQPAPGASVAEFSTRHEFGFLTMELVGDTWQFTERDVLGKPVMHCSLKNKKLHCDAEAPSSTTP